MSNIIKVVADAPSKIDLLGYSSYVNALYKIITNENTFTPFNIGILGEWGTGKSTLMMQLASKLNAYDFPVVIFNPWKYDDKEEIVYSLIQTILLSFDKQERKSDIKDITVGIAKGLGQMLLSKVVSASTFHTVDFDKLMQIYSEKKEENVKFINEFESVFTELVSKYALDKKLVVFIDDLDRCLPDNIIKILESIKLFLSVPKCIFVIGIDNAVIQEAISEKYGKNYNFSGKDYLEKIIQLSFSIPNPSEKNIEDYAKKIFGIHAKVDSIKLIVSGCKSNPRRIKRFVNSFNLIEAVINEEIINKTRSVELNLDILSFVLLLQIQFSAAYNYYQVNLKDCNDLLQMVNEKRYFDKEQIERIRAMNTAYAHVLENREFVDFIKRASSLGLKLTLGEEGLSEYLSATKSIAIDNDAADNYYLPEIVRKKGILNGVFKDLYLINAGTSKLNVVKLLKELSGLGLKESKDLVDYSSATPTLILQDVPKEKQKEYKQLFEKAGAEVEYR